MRLPVILLVAVALVGCAHSPPPAGRALPVVDPLLSPDSLGRNLSLSQIATGEYGDQRHTVRIEIEVTSARLIVVGLSPVGIPLFSLEQTAGDAVTRSTAIGDMPFDPRHMLSDLQLAYWPADALAGSLAPKGLTLEEGRKDGFRRVTDASGRPVVEILYSGLDDTKAAITIQHFDHPYLLRIKTIEGLVS